MTRDDALQLLTSPKPHERLRAARYFARSLALSDMRPLRAALKSESVSYIKRALEQAVHSRPEEREIDVDAASEPQIPESVRKELFTKAVEEVTGILMHEIAPIVGVLRAEIAKSLPEYETSRAKESLDRLVALLEAVAELKKAASAPRMQQLDFPTLLKKLTDDILPVGVSMQGPIPFLITSDSGLLSLAISNGLRNARDAVVGRMDDPNAVVLNWGESDVEYWLSILDFGPGIVGPPEGAFNIGTTSKHGHLGFGLAIARQSMSSLAGTVRLYNSSVAGAIFEIRWCK
jgi:signal transduction histidine kinase